MALGARAEILATSPLPDFTAIGGPAFVARMKGEDSNDMMAILCNSGMPPRTDVINSMRAVTHNGMLRLLESGVVHWPQDDMHYFALAYQRPLAPRLVNSIDEPIPAMSEDVINRHFIAPMIGVMLELARTGVFHNAIRTTNIFWRAGGAASPQLGECLSAPPGIGQPALFETLERGFCRPIGRGMGTHIDDCYAFGVTLALVILGQNPFAGMDDQAVVQAKSERGSFNALIGNRRLSPAHVELLRGLLIDDPRQRWTAADLEQWQSGRRLTPKNTDAGRRASRQIDFMGKPYVQIRPLATALSGNIGEAAQLIESGALDKWLRRSMGDDDKAADLDEAHRSLKAAAKPTHYEDQLVARACIALDPSGPIRYRGIAAMPNGISNVMADAVLTGNNIQALGEIVASQLVTFWVDMQKDAKGEFMSLGQQYERMRGLIERAGFGSGFERILYEVNPGLHCLSPMLRSQYVMNARMLMMALERIANSAQRGFEPMDRHIAAFLVVRDRRSEALFETMSLPENSPRRGLAILTLYAEMQQRHGPDALPGLAQWLMPLLEPAIQRYMGKMTREKLQTQLRETVGFGDLNAMLRLLDDQRRVEFDKQQFMAARMLYLNTLKEIAHIENRLANRELVIQETGKPMAASLSGFLAVILVLVAFVRAIWQYLGF